VTERDSVGRIDVERLRLGGHRGTGGGITHLPDTDISFKALHMTGMKDVPHQPVVLAQVQPSLVTSHDTGSILPAMLQYS
jgi:hypothetical protein